MYAVYINRGYAYFDEKTRTHLTRSNPKRVFTDEELATLDMSGIERGIRLGTLRKEEITVSKEDKDEVVKEMPEAVSEEEKIEEPIAEEMTEETEETQETEEMPDEEEAEKEQENIIEEDGEENLEDLTKEGEPRCQARKADGTQCTFAAKVPEDNPIYCGRHRDLLD